MNTCPCCSSKTYSACCERFISGKELPQTPEELMRSRYTAYSKINVDYIRQTMKSPAADQFDAEEARQWAKAVTWEKLEIIQTSHEQNKGFVEFIAYFSQQLQKQYLHECSEFHFDDGRWYYVDGKISDNKSSPRSVIKIGRNVACSCGSGKKYKKCCGIS